MKITKRYKLIASKKLSTERLATDIIVDSNPVPEEPITEGVITADELVKTPVLKMSVEPQAEIIPRISSAEQIRKSQELYRSLFDRRAEERLYSEDSNVKIPKKIDKKVIEKFKSEWIAEDGTPDFVSLAAAELERRKNGVQQLERKRLSEELSYRDYEEKIKKEMPKLNTDWISSIKTKPKADVDEDEPCSTYTKSRVVAFLNGMEFEKKMLLYEVVFGVTDLTNSDEAKEEVRKQMSTEAGCLKMLKYLEENKFVKHKGAHYQTREPSAELDSEGGSGFFNIWNEL